MNEMTANNKTRDKEGGRANLIGKDNEVQGEVEINTDALKICPACGKKSLVLYTAINQPSKLFCLGCGEYWMGVQNEN